MNERGASHRLDLGTSVRAESQAPVVPGRESATQHLDAARPPGAGRSKASLFSGVPWDSGCEGTGKRARLDQSAPPSEAGDASKASRDDGATEATSAAPSKHSAEAKDDGGDAEGERGSDPGGAALDGNGEHAQEAASNEAEAGGDEAGGASMEDGAQLEASVNGGQGGGDAASDTGGGDAGALECDGAESDGADSGAEHEGSDAGAGVQAAQAAALAHVNGAVDTGSGEGGGADHAESDADVEAVKSAGPDSQGEETSAHDAGAGGAESDGAEREGAENEGGGEGTESESAESAGSESGGAESEGAESEGAESEGAQSEGSEHEDPEAEGAAHAGAEMAGPEGDGAEASDAGDAGVSDHDSAGDEAAVHAGGDVDHGDLMAHALTRRAESAVSDATTTLSSVNGHGARAATHGAAATAKDVSRYAAVDAALQPSDDGTPLSPQLRGEMEGAVGIDLSAVRVHTSGKASDLLTSLGGKAAAKGRHIIVGNGINLESADGRAVLEHELHHVVQFSEGRVGKLGGSGEHQRDGLEAEAESKSGRPRDRARRSIRRLPMPQTGAALFFGIPNPIKAAKSVGRSAWHGVKKAGGAVVRKGKHVVRKVKKSVRKAVHGVGKVAHWVKNAIKGGLNAVRSLRSLARVLSGFPLVGHLLAAPFKALADAAEAAARAARKVKALIRMLGRGARTLARRAKGYARRGPAYFQAARAAASRAVNAGIHGARSVVHRGKSLMAAAVHAVWRQAMRRFNTVKHGLEASWRGVKAGAAAINTGIHSAGTWIRKNGAKIKAVGRVVLDVAGFMPPPVGPIASVGSMIIDASEGNWLSASITATSLIPYVGRFGYAAKGARAGVRVSKVMNKVFRASRHGLHRSRVRIRRTRILKGRVRGTQNHRIARFKHSLHRRVRGVTKRYYDFRARGRAYMRHMAGSVRAHRRKLGAKFRHINRVYTPVYHAAMFYRSVLGLKDDYKKAKQKWKKTH